jgi:hypothetical protein
MATLIRMPKRRRGKSGLHREVLQRNQQLRVVFDHTDQTYQSLVAGCILVLRRWWHRTLTFLGIQQAATYVHFEGEKNPSCRRQWLDALQEKEAHYATVCQPPPDEIDTKHLEETGQTPSEDRHVHTMRLCKELNLNCDALYAQFHDTNWQRHRAQGKDVQELDRQINDILDRYHRARATYESTVRALASLHKDQGHL